jgi:chromosome segregation ATPase
MKTEEPSSESALAASVAELRERFPRTPDLYREVCVLLFFRHGITPTANKLYQLVRKGSMSAPTEALNHFWKTLRERSRVTIEHTDLPEELRTVAGDLVASLWKSAQSKSLESLATLQAEAAAAVDSAKADLASAEADRAGVLQDLEHLRLELRTSEEDASQLRQELAAAAATKKGLEQRLEDARRELNVVQVRMDQSSAAHTAERERLADRTRLAEDRFADMEKRALVEIDRERTAAAKLQKLLESERAAHNSANERLRADHNEAQTTIGKLREQIGSLQHAVSAQTQERDRERAELASLRSQLEAAIRQGVSADARAAQLREEVDRLHSIYVPSRRSSASKRPRKKADGAG